MINNVDRSSSRCRGERTVVAMRINTTMARFMVTPTMPVIVLQGEGVGPSIHNSCRATTHAPNSAAGCFTAGFPSDPQLLVQWCALNTFPLPERGPVRTTPTTFVHAGRLRLAKALLDGCKKWINPLIDWSPYNFKGDQG